jgi:hypothetical protein
MPRRSVNGFARTFCDRRAGRANFVRAVAGAVICAQGFPVRARPLHGGIFR